jgi:hypothetical protein
MVIYQSIILTHSRHKIQCGTTCLMLPDIRTITALYEGSQALPACPSDKKCVKMKVKMGQ